MSLASGGQPDDSMTALDVEQVRSQTFVKCVEFHEKITSTNDRALHLARDASIACPLLVVADRQTGGRGRGSNRWWASRGSLTFSLLLEAAQDELPQNSWPQVSLNVGLAVCEAIGELLGNGSTQLKWPNDVYLEGRKVCGILVESPHTAPPRLVVGVGINVNNSGKNAPMELNGSAVALCDVAGRYFSLTEVLTRVLFHISETLNHIGLRDEELRKRWRARCLLTGRFVHLDLGSRRMEGICQGIDDEGALIIETATGIDRCFGGTVTHF